MRIDIMRRKTVTGKLVSLLTAAALAFSSPLLPAATATADANAAGIKPGQALVVGMPQGVSSAPEATLSPPAASTRQRRGRRGDRLDP
jgi:hypothetical protein